jgi:hypothetical protein
MHLQPTAHYLNRGQPTMQHLNYQPPSHKQAKVSLF